jgi:SHS2 domain-containing protein
MAERPTYDEIEHTADVGVALSAPDLRSAFELAAASMFDLMCDLDSVGASWRREVRVDGRDGDLENLLIRWLAELLYIFETEHVLLSTFAVARFESGVVEALVAGEPYDAARHAVKIEIKAATYHDLRIEETDDGWRVAVIFDT